MKYVFTSESVTEGHPDKVCDKISDAILDDILSRDPEARVACETLATTGLVLISGEITTETFCDFQEVARSTLKEIGYTSPESGFNWKDCSVLNSVHEQSPEIAQGVNEGEGDETGQGAGDQGLMFGYACRETPELMPLPIQLAHRLTERLTQVRKDKILPWLRPDGKSQVTVEYSDGVPTRVTNVVIATQHKDMLEEFQTEQKEHDFIRKAVIEQVVQPVLKQAGIAFEQAIIVNGTGRFVLGGPEADTGLTGRKIIVDTYGGYAPHGGGAFSGKDPSKVDRSATYMARYIAKNIVAAGLAENCEVQLSYGIGVAEPTSVQVKTFGTGKLPDDQLTGIVTETFALRPKDIIRHLDLKKPRYKAAAAYGHFGRETSDFTWEKTDMIETLKKYLKKDA
ncbi:MAG: methionine adenosyltransferase [FCB group bacterium]|nr:methionine adenosyltransferase [FCB group bacterium]